MHKRGLKNKAYLQLIEAYSLWLSRLNYSEKSIQERTRQLYIFLEWINEKGINRLVDLQQQHLVEYNNWLHQRPLKSKTIIGYIGALKLCNQYLELHGETPLLTTKLTIGKDLEESRTILSKIEVNQLYQSCSPSIWGRRDRAMIAIFYGCGLRSKEGRNLHQTDLNLKTGILHVRKGKGNKERYVPLSTGVQKELLNWLENGLPFFCPPTNYLLPNSKGKLTCGHGLNKRLKALCETAEVKEISLHGLRHSIATHLLESGMPLHQIGQFLGHKSLESTQIYTRIIHEF